MNSFFVSPKGSGDSLPVPRGLAITSSGCRVSTADVRDKDITVTNDFHLRRGDAIDVVRADGGTAVVTVIGVEAVPKSNFPTESVYGNVAYPALRLIACGGPFDPGRGSYLDNIVVYAYLSGVASG
jgi:hypothetical protein